MNVLKHIRILDYSVINERAPTVAADICDGLSVGERRSIVFLNPHSVVLADRDSILRDAIHGASIIFCDGVGLSFASLLLNRRRVSRVYGFEFFMALSRELSGRPGSRVFFLGGSEQLIEDLVAKYKVDFPGISELGWFCPPYQPSFSKLQIAKMARRVSEFNADVLWIGLGSPKQEKVLREIMPICNARCGVAIGAALDFYAGRIPHAPLWIRRLGLQWLHRLLIEPRRLWRRTLISGPIFLGRIVRSLFVHHFAMRE